MKVRNGFVSNSSSSSFIISESEKQEAIRKGLVLINVGDLRKYLTKYEDARLELIEALKRINAEHWTGYGSYIEISLEDIKDLKDEDYITEPYDRDQAYSQDMDYGVFQGDL